jgi:hypothetical protein
MSSLGFMCIHKTFAFRFRFAVKEEGKNTNLPFTAVYLSPCSGA